MLFSKLNLGLLYPKIFVQTKLCFKFARSYAEQDSASSTIVAYGVIGNTAGFGPVVLGSSPSRPTMKAPDFNEIRGFLFLRVQQKWDFANYMV